MIGPKLEAIIGIEVHAQLATATKLFCACPNRFGCAPNANTCEVCTGQPGALPVLNEGALALAVRAGLALEAELQPLSRFDRKHYFYSDLPKGYQITQWDRPLARGGRVELGSGESIGLERIHLEEDAGKALHGDGETLVDLGRAGVPLIEVVSRPELTSAREACEYVERLREILRYGRISSGDMEKGALRCDVNVSMHHPGAPLGTRVELKNLNSLRHVREAIDFELERQSSLLTGGQTVEQETRSYDPVAGATRRMRGKEDGADYRYFPDPDLPPIALDTGLLQREAAALPDLPAARRERYISELGLSDYDADVLTRNRELCDLFEDAVRLGGDPKRAANWITNDVAAARAGEKSAPEVLEREELAGALVELIELVEDGTASTPAARTILARLLRRGGRPRALLESLSLEQVSDETDLGAWCRAALAQDPDAAAAVRAGNDKAIGALIGAVMRASSGRADPGGVRRLLTSLITEQA